MRRTKMEEKNEFKVEELPLLNIELDDLEFNEDSVLEIPKEIKTNYTSKLNKLIVKSTDYINCLRNERIIVRHIPKESGMVTNPKHILFGGMAENAVRQFTVPTLSSGMYVNVLTDSEKEFLEEIMGLEVNALSIYKKVDNFWENNFVRLTKQDNYLNLADPSDYIKYKILLANKDRIAPSLQVLLDSPKATYLFVIIVEGEETRAAKSNMSTTMLSYKEFGKIENDIFKLRLIVETIEGKPTAPNTKLDFLLTQINKLIQANSKLFLKVITDPLLDTKVLIKKATEKGVISSRGNWLYIREGNIPLCEENLEPTLNIAAIFLNNPKHQELKFTLETKVKD